TVQRRRRSLSAGQCRRCEPRCYIGPLRMGYLVLARKWRPQTFDDMTGQEHVVRTVANAIKLDRVAHAYLFCGPRGVGKTTAARLLACCRRPPPPPTAHPRPPVGPASPAWRPPPAPGWTPRKSTARQTTAPRPPGKPVKTQIPSPSATATRSTSSTRSTCSRGRRS